MFSLHETTKIGICRAAFLALCIAPTCAVLGWSVFVNTPAYQQAHERAIAARLGWQATLQRASSPRPGTLLYQSLELSDPASGQVLARLPFVEVRTGGETVLVKLSFPAIVNGTRLDAFWKLAQELAPALSGSRPVRFEAQNLTLHLPDGNQSFSEVLGEIDGAAGQARARLSFRRTAAGGEAAEPCLLFVTRTRDATRVAHTIRLNTGATPLPASLISPLWPGVRLLGKTCHFTGRITAAEQADNWTTELEGILSNIDLDTLVSGQFPHKLSGLAEARLKSVVLTGGRIDSATGSIVAGPGEISRSLLQSAATHLHVRASTLATKGSADAMGYERLSVGFDIGPSGMALRGEVPVARGVMLADGRRVLAFEPPLVTQPVIDLVRTLVPQSEMQVPATRDSISLAHWLPLPSNASTAAGDEALWRARPLTVKPQPAEGTIQR